LTIFRKKNKTLKQCAPQVGATSAGDYTNPNVIYLE
jgi:hypothetical protein